MTRQGGGLAGVASLSPPRCGTPASTDPSGREARPFSMQGGISTRVASSTVSKRRQRQILGLLLAAFAVLAVVSVATWRAPLLGQGPWAPPNACGPVGALLASVLVWTFGRFAAFGVPILSAVWAWNRLRTRPGAPLLITSLVGTLLVFEICTLLGLGGLDRTAWVGAWGFAAQLALRSALGQIGSWIVASTLFAVSVLAATELGFHWIAGLARRALVDPARGLGNAWAELQLGRAHHHHRDLLDAQRRRRDRRVLAVDDDEASAVVGDDRRLELGPAPILDDAPDQALAAP